MKNKNDILLSFLGGLLPSSGTRLLIDVNTDFGIFLIKVLATVGIGNGNGEFFIYTGSIWLQFHTH